MHGHPPQFGPSHPWHDPLAPQDIFNPRPDADLAFAGPMAPRPEDFPFTDQGRRDYYAAVSAAAQQQMGMQQHQAAMQHQQAHAVQVARIRAEEAALAAERERQAGFLLLGP